MKIDDVPQDRGMITDNRREICYAVDDDGRYVMTGSAGWEPKNIANRQAWDRIDAAASSVLDAVNAGRRSPLAYHMARHQMGIGLLAKYAGINRLQVWRHLRPRPFSRLNPDTLRRYAEALDMTVRALTRVPNRHTTAAGDADADPDQKG